MTKENLENLMELEYGDRMPATTIKVYTTDELHDSGYKKFLIIGNKNGKDIWKSTSCDVLTIEDTVNIEINDDFLNIFKSGQLLSFLNYSSGTINYWPE